MDVYSQLKKERLIKTIIITLFVVINLFKLGVVIYGGVILHNRIEMHSISDDMLLFYTLFFILGAL